MNKEETTNPKENRRRASFYVSGDPALFRQVGNTLLRNQIESVKQADIGERTL